MLGFKFFSLHYNLSSSQCSALQLAAAFQNYAPVLGDALLDALIKLLLTTPSFTD